MEETVMLGLSQLDDEDLIWPRIPGPPRLPRVHPARPPAAKPKPPAGNKPASSPPKSVPTKQALGPEVGWASKVMGACAAVGLAGAALGWLLFAF